MSTEATLATIVAMAILLLFLAILFIIALAVLRRTRAVAGYYWLALALSVSISAVFVSQSYGVIFWYLGEFARRVLALFVSPTLTAINCIENCSRDLLASYVSGISILTYGGNYYDIPEGSIVPAIVVTLLVYVIFVTIYGRIRSGQMSLDSTIISFLFGTTILFSFYLCLTALLTIPLMQKEVVQDGFSVEDLALSLTNSMPSEADFEARFLPVVLEDGLKTSDMDFVRSEIERTNSLPDAIYQKLLANKSQAIELFKAESAVGLGGREAVAHFSELVRWFILERSELENALDYCLNAARRAEFTLQTAARSGEATASSRLDDTLQDLSACNNVSSGGSAMPARKSRADALPIVGNWSGWLIRSESMPLTIIVGLVGFSFLGASLSRIIRAKKTSDVIWFSISDLLMVTISGASAALAVFVASYGGLAVVSQAADSTDPNPYIVFILCLAAAIYSEDVWAWLRTKFLEQIKQRDEVVAAPDAAEAKPPVVEPAVAEPPVP